MSELKELVNDCIRIGRKYYKTGDVDYLPKWSQVESLIKEINKKVYHVIDNATFMYLDDRYSYKQIYQVILLLTGVNLESEEEK